MLLARVQPLAQPLEAGAPQKIFQGRRVRLLPVLLLVWARARLPRQHVWLPVPALRVALLGGVAERHLTPNNGFAAELVLYPRVFLLVLPLLAGVLEEQL